MIVFKGVLTYSDLEINQLSVWCNLKVAGTELGSSSFFFIMLDEASYLLRLLLTMEPEPLLNVPKSGTIELEADYLPSFGVFPVLELSMIEIVSLQLPRSISI